MIEIKAKREAVGLTQAKFADTLGVSRTAVAMWETTNAYPRAELLPRIAKLLDCTIDELYRQETKTG